MFGSAGRMITFFLVAVNALGSPLASNAGEKGCTFNDSTGVATFVLQHGSNELRREGEAIYFRTQGDGASQCGNATVKNTDRIRLVENLDDPLSILIDFSNGRFGPGRTTEDEGDSEIEIKADSSIDEPLRLEFIGTSEKDLLIVGRRGAVWNSDGDLDFHLPTIRHATLFGREGRDRLSVRGNGTTGHGLVRGGDPETYLFGGKGQDRLEGSETHDYLSGATGSDRLFGGGGNDKLLGGDGNDEVFGNQGQDFMKGNDGEDELSGGRKADYIEGNKGRDFLDGDEGIDKCLGGPGNDRYEECERPARPR